MNYLFASIVLLAIILLALWVFISSVIGIARDWPTYITGWRRMEPFERHLFQMGLLFFFVIPVLEDHPAADWYVARVIIKLLPALASSFFVAGVLAFMRQVHEIRLNNHA